VRVRLREPADGHHDPGQRTVHGAGRARITPGTAARSLLDTLAVAASGGGIFPVLLTIAGVVLAVILAFIYVLRLMAIVLLAAAAPLTLAPMRCRNWPGWPAGGGAPWPPR
jgi:hypothetical protein